MAKISFSFCGWVRGANVETGSEPNGKDVDVSKLSSAEIVDMLNSGKLSICLGDHLYDSDDAEIEISDYEISE